MSIKCIYYVRNFWFKYSYQHHYESDLFIERRIFIGQNRFVSQTGTLQAAILALDLARLFNYNHSMHRDARTEACAHKMTTPQGVYFVRPHVLDLMYFQENINPLNNHKMEYSLPHPRVQIGTSTRLLSLSLGKVSTARQAPEYYMGAYPLCCPAFCPLPRGNGRDDYIFILNKKYLLKEPSHASHKTNSDHYRSL